MCARGASFRSGQRKEGIELTAFGGYKSLWALGGAGLHPGERWTWLFLARGSLNLTCEEFQRKIKLKFYIFASFCRSLKVIKPFYRCLGHLDPFQVFEAFFFFTKLLFYPYSSWRWWSWTRREVNPNTRVDRARCICRGKKYNPSKFPRGFPRGVQYFFCSNTLPSFDTCK